MIKNFISKTALGFLALSASTAIVPQSSSLASRVLFASESYTFIPETPEDFGRLDQLLQNENYRQKLEHIYIPEPTPKDQREDGLIDQAAQPYFEYVESLLANEILPNLTKISTTNPIENSALFLAAQYDYVNITRILLNNGHNPDTPTEDTQVDDRGYTAVHEAASYGSLNVLNLFIEKGANFQALDNDLNSPLDQAFEHASNDTIELLINRLGTDCLIDTDFNDGHAGALHKALDRRLLDVISTLCSLGVKVDILDQDYYTALATAMLNKETEIARLLVELGADLDATQPDGSTPRIIAYENGLYEFM